MKAQINLEFVAAAFIYIAALGTIATFGSDMLPELSGDIDEASMHLEAKRVTTQMLTNKGHHTSGPGTDWETNDATVRTADAFGLASNFMEIDREKLERLRTINPRRSSTNYMNYSQFKNLTGADNQYKFNFTWMPIVETHRTFERCSSPFAANDGKPNITEPEDCGTADPDAYYLRAGNRIHYGSTVLEGDQYNFLVTSHNGIYNTTYVSTDWDFQGRDPKGAEDSFTLSGETYNIKRFQNRDERPGAMLVLQKHLKTFGASVDSDATVRSMERYAVMEDEPVRIGVLTW